MNIIFLGSKKTKQIEIIKFLRDDGNTVFRTSKRIDSINIESYDFLISFGYRYIIRENILKYFGSKAINLHISFLPWNRGADPNFWSILEGTPKGVSIHIIDKGIDTGDIIAQENIVFEENDTLSSSYEKLQFHITELFKEIWPKIKDGLVTPKKQNRKSGSFHFSKEKNPYFTELKNGWETKLIDIKVKRKNENR